MQMFGKVNVPYGFKTGDRILVSDRKMRKKGTVVREYPFHVLVDWGMYRSSVNKVDVYTGDTEIRSI